MKEIIVIRQKILELEKKLKDLDPIEDSFAIARIYDNIALLYYAIDMLYKKEK